MYLRLMRLAPTFIVASICIALLGMQLSGMHLHASEQGDSGGLHTTHVHVSDPDGHDHSADFDVSAFELGAIWSKLLAFLPTLAITLLAVAWVIHSLRAPPPQRLTQRRRIHWRPPLRAPPLFT